MFGLPVRNILRAIPRLSLVQKTDRLWTLMKANGFPGGLADQAKQVAWIQWA